MKFVVQEYLVERRVLLLRRHARRRSRSARTTRTTTAWQELKRYNRRMKLTIEDAWATAGAADAPATCACACGATRAASSARSKKRRAAARGRRRGRASPRAWRRCSSARGYEVELAYDGRAGARRASTRDPLPDLSCCSTTRCPSSTARRCCARMRDDPRLTEPAGAARDGLDRSTASRLPRACGACCASRTRARCCSRMIRERRLERGARSRARSASWPLPSARAEAFTALGARRPLVVA